MDIFSNIFIMTTIIVPKHLLDNDVNYVMFDEV